MKISKGCQVIEEAIEMVQEAMDKIDEVLSEFSEHRFVQHYEVYGKYGFNQLLGEGNPYDDGLQTLIKELTKIEKGKK